MNKKYVVTLTPDERQQLGAPVGRGKAAVRKLKRARVLLKADVSPGGPARSDGAIRQAFGAGLVAIYRVRQSFVQGGVEAALTPRPKRRHRRRKPDGGQEAHLIALACSQPPSGRRRWALRLLAGRMVELGHAQRLPPETIRRTLKRTS